jgi:hypothetical protein
MPAQANQCAHVLQGVTKHSYSTAAAILLATPQPAYRKTEDLDVNTKQSSTPRTKLVQNRRNLIDALVTIKHTTTHKDTNQSGT